MPRLRELAALSVGIIIGMAWVSELEAAPILAVVSETDGAVSTWWPNERALGDEWALPLRDQGLDAIRPAEQTQAPRLSPVVYALQTLSVVNARALGQIFGASVVLGGNVTYVCEGGAEGKRCRGEAELYLSDDRQADETYRASVEAIALDEAMAKAQIRARLASEVALRLHVRASRQKEIPKLIDKPVVLLSSLPDADTLVAIRKRLKRVDGVSDVAERYVVQGMLALEINPGQEMTQSTFDAMMQVFLADTADGFLVRELSRSAQGILVEIGYF